MEKLKKIFLGTAISVAMTFILLIIFSYILVKSDIKEQFINSGIIIVTGLSIFVGAFFSNIKIKKGGIINGILVSVMYLGIIYITSSAVSDNYSITMSSFFMMLIGIILGAFGGILGVNIK